MVAASDEFYSGGDARNGHRCALIKHFRVTHLARSTLSPTH